MKNNAKNERHDLANALTAEQWLNKHNKVTVWDVGDRPFLETPNSASPLMFRLIRASEIGRVGICLQAIKDEYGEDLSRAQTLEIFTLYCAGFFTPHNNLTKAHIDRVGKIRHLMPEHAMQALVQSMEFFGTFSVHFYVEKLFFTFYDYTVDRLPTDQFYYLNYCCHAARMFMRTDRPDFALAILLDASTRCPKVSGLEKKMIENTLKLADDHSVPLDVLEKRIVSLNKSGANLLPLKKTSGDCNAQYIIAQYQDTSPIDNLTIIKNTGTSNIKAKARSAAIRMIDMVPGLKPRIKSILNR